MGLAVGDAVVYASHGIGQVEARHRSGSDLPDTVVIVFEGGLRVTLPLDRALDTLRPVASEADLAKVRRTLGADPGESDEPWSKRFRATREKVSLGEVTGLAEVVRDGVLRDRQSAGGSRSVSASSERGLYLHARALLAAEIALARGIDAADADAWIVKQTGADSSRAGAV
jgi:RNA polymerase-interacting CarD/CdnL/TRCF family regulator